MAKVVQAELRSGVTVRVCWIDPKAKPGDRVTLRNSEDPGRLWDVVSLGTQMDLSAINRGWNNNI